MLLSKMTGGQSGKFITVYTSDANKHEIGDESKLIVRTLAKLDMSGLSGPDILIEKKLAPMVFTRFSEDYTKSGY